jgi:hypothetical protein
MVDKSLLHKISCIATADRKCKMYGLPHTEEVYVYCHIHLSLSGRCVMRTQCSVLTMLFRRFRTIVAS